MEATSSHKINTVNRLILVSLGIIYVWFGTLKLFPGMSPAEQLAGNTIQIMSFQMLTAALGVKLLGWWELIMGLSFLLGIKNKFILFFFFIHMAGTFLPFFVLPDYSFNQTPLVLTLIGQYIIKNILFILVGYLLWIDK